MNSTSPHFLGVNASVSGKSWRTRLENTRLATAIGQRHDLPEILSRVLAGRGVMVDEVEAFLTPTLRSLMPQPEALRDMEAGADRLAHAIRRGEAIAIIGDYDVDGMTSTALLVRFLRSLAIDPLVHIPDRLEEGYGPSITAVENLRRQGAQVLVTVDCGTMAHVVLAHATGLGLDVIVVDHHQAIAELPSARAVINPNRLDDLSGLGYLAAVGVTLILVAAVIRVLRRADFFSAANPAPDLFSWLDLVALGTICDVVPLVGLNRAYVNQGLKVMGKRCSPGLAALADTARLRRRPDPHALGYVLGPRLNAAGRLGLALEGLGLLTTDDSGEASIRAQTLEVLNKQRQDIELKAFEVAAADAERQLENDPHLRAIVVAGRDWHPGVLGLISARIKERYGRPAIAMSTRAGEPFATASGRSVPGIDLGALIREAQEAGIVVKGGGHAMAAGLTLESRRIEEFAAFMSDALARNNEPAAAPELVIDGALSSAAAKPDLIELLERAGPFGAGNPAPVFAFPAHFFSYADLAGKDHVRCTLKASDGFSLKAVAFRSLGSPLGEMILSLRDRPAHVAGRLVIDDWNGARGAQLLIEDAAIVE
ncbi:single-stranded-DNA-specific exonuclease RecJ [Rhodoligotrophos appendicifer]|uniref:single-stranded-DNA-specific exonuclease RecJ n=1 Tax=Rhodoligotrophos appendicifer TaxID=987056 RepID=UPI0011856AD3|nr:single-stranded-DNA-specific exonuclease RecJ [Rhodoligotrophos appendicifer]